MSTDQVPLPERPITIRNQLLDQMCAHMGRCFLRSGLGSYSGLLRQERTRHVYYFWIGQQTHYFWFCMTLIPNRYAPKCALVSIEIRHLAPPVITGRPWPPGPENPRQWLFVRVRRRQSSSGRWKPHSYFRSQDAIAPPDS
jgi:hypothetical protein